MKRGCDSDEMVTKIKVIYGIVNSSGSTLREKGEHEEV